MTEKELIQYFYFNVPCSEYDTEADKYQDVFTSEKINKEQFLKDLAKYVPGKGINYIRDFLKSDYNFRKTLRDLEKIYKDSGYSSDYPFQQCISVIVFEIARALSFAEGKSAYTSEGYRRIEDYLKTEEFAKVFRDVFLKQKPVKAQYMQTQNDRYAFEASIFAHFAARRITDDADYVDDYISFLNTYDNSDDRDANFPFVNEQEKQIARKINDRINQIIQESRNTAAVAPKPENKRPSANADSKIPEDLKKKYLNTGKRVADLERIISVSKTVYLNKAPMLYFGSSPNDYAAGIIAGEIYYQENKKDQQEGLIDRFLTRKNIVKDIESIKQTISAEDMQQYFSLEGYSISFIKELALSLFKLFRMDFEEVADLVKEIPDCKRSYNYLKNKSNDLVLAIYYSAFDEYVSNLFGSLLLNIHNRKIQRMIQKHLEEADIVYPECYHNMFMVDTANRSRAGGIQMTQNYVEISAGIYIATFLKEPAVAASFLEFHNYFLARYLQCIVLPEKVPADEEAEKEINPIVEDYVKKQMTELQSRRPEGGIRDAYAIYSAVAKTFRLNDTFLWPQNPMDAYQNPEYAEFMTDFTYYYFNRYIGKDKAIKSLSFKDYFQAYQQALIYKELIDHILDDDLLIPPDYDLSFEEEYKELIEQSEEERSAEDKISLQKENVRLKENMGKWKNEAQSLHGERNDLDKSLKRSNAKNEELEMEIDSLRRKNDELLKISFLYDEMMAEQLKVQPEKIYQLLSSKKIAISGGNKAMVQRLLNKYPNMIWYEKVSDITVSAGQMDYIIIMTQFNAHKMSEAIEKQVGNAKTKIILLGEVRSNFELTEKMMFNKIKTSEDKDV